MFTPERTVPSACASVTNNRVMSFRSILDIFRDFPLIRYGSLLGQKDTGTSIGTKITRYARYRMVAYFCHPHVII